MKKNVYTKLVLAFLSALLLASGWMWLGRGAEEKQGSESSLLAPPFVNSAQAKTLTAPSVISEEAGIAAWTKASTMIDLSSAINAFRTVEIEESNYILGSVPLDNYPESEDVHVYVHKDGWILAYYLSHEPTGKIFDWSAYQSNGHTTITTKLENAINITANQAGVITDAETFYHFQYPNADKLLLVTEHSAAGGAGNEKPDPFEINLPGDFVYYERSWSLGCTECSGHFSYRLNDTEIEGFSYMDDYINHQGLFSLSELGTGVVHTVEIEALYADGYGGLALVYGAP